MTRSDINAEADYKTCRMGNADKSGLLGRTAIPPSPIHRQPNAGAGLTGESEGYSN